MYLFDLILLYVNLFDFFKVYIAEDRRWHEKKIPMIYL